MNKKIFASVIILAPLMFAQIALADTEQLVTPHSSQQTSQALTKSDILDATQGYVLEQSERPQARRSALFAQIMDAKLKRSTLAKSDEVSKKPES